MITDIKEFCDKHHACVDGREWALLNCTDMVDAWDKLEPEWLIWVATRPGVLDDKQLILFACWCVRQVWHLLTDVRSRNAVEVSERYANGQATDEELTAAWAATRDAARDAAWAAARDVAYAAAWYAAWDAAYAAARDAARDAAWAAARDAAYAAAWDAARDAAYAAARDAARDAAWAAARDAAYAAAREKQAEYLRSLRNPFLTRT